MVSSDSGDAGQLGQIVAVDHGCHVVGGGSALGPGPQDLAQLGGVDVISFTAGVGENSPLVRAAALATLGFLGVHVDEARNEERRRGIRVISTDDSPVTVLVVPTNEELEIARQTLAVMGQ